MEKDRIGNAIEMVENLEAKYLSFQLLGFLL